LRGTPKVRRSDGGGVSQSIHQPSARTGTPGDVALAVRQPRCSNIRHIRDTDRHIRDTDRHIRDTDRHIRDTDRQKDSKHTTHKHKQ